MDDRKLIAKIDTYGMNYKVEWTVWYHPTIGDYVIWREFRETSIKRVCNFLFEVDVCLKEFIKQEGLSLVPLFIPPERKEEE